MLWILFSGCFSGWDYASDLDQDGYSISDGDCNDLNSMINPNAIEICDELDNNCDGNIDESQNIGA